MIQRNRYFDYLRGIAIIMVVGIHTFKVEETNLQGCAVDVTTMVRQSLNCAVPIFLAISGYFLCSKKLDTWSECKAFWHKQMPKVYVPAMIVSLPYLALALKHGTNPIVAIAMVFICGYSIYYFIALILQYYALLPILQKVNSGGVILSGIISLGCISVVSYLTKIQGCELPLIGYAGPFPVWIVFYTMGCYMYKCKRNYSLLLPLLMVVLGMVMSYAETYYWNANYGGGFGIKFSSFIYSIAVIVLLFSAKAECAYKLNVVNKVVEYTGRISFAVYLYHLFVVDAFSILHVLARIPWIFRWLICLTATIAVVEILKRILPQKYHWCFGV